MHASTWLWERCVCVWGYTGRWHSAGGRQGPPSQHPEPRLVPGGPPHAALVALVLRRPRATEAGLLVVDEQVEVGSLQHAPAQAGVGGLKAQRALGLRLGARGAAQRWRHAAGSPRGRWLAHSPGGALGPRGGPAQASFPPAPQPRRPQPGCLPRLSLVRAQLRLRQVAPHDAVPLTCMRAAAAPTGCTTRCSPSWWASNR